MIASEMRLSRPIVTLTAVLVTLLVPAAELCARTVEMDANCPMRRVAVEPQSATDEASSSCHRTEPKPRTEASDCCLVEDGKAEAVGQSAPRLETSRVLAAVIAQPSALPRAAETATKADRIAHPPPDQLALFSVYLL